MKRGTCITCAYYHMVKNECRYDPPTPISEEESVWPIVDNNDWCSHWFSAIVSGGERKNYAQQINDGDACHG